MAAGVVDVEEDSIAVAIFVTFWIWFCIILEC